MGDFDAAIAVAFSLATETETDFPRRKHATLISNPTMRFCEMVEPLIRKQTTNVREPISLTECLSIRLRYLATGNTFEDLKFISAIAPQK